MTFFNITTRPALFAFGLILCLSGPARAGYVGFSVDALFESPINVINVDGGAVVVGPGAEWTALAGVDIDVSDTQIVLTSPQNAGFNGSAFSGFQFTSTAAQTGDILGVSASSNISGFTASRVTFDTSDIWVDLHGLSFFHFPTAGSLVLTVTFANPVPAPGGLPLLTSGLAGLGLIRRLKRRSRGTPEFP